MTKMETRVARIIIRGSLKLRWETKFLDEAVEVELLAEVAVVV
jgi:hypothetical protein